MLLILAVSESVSGEPPRLSSDAGNGPLGNGARLQDLYSKASDVHLVELLYIWHLFLDVGKSTKRKPHRGQAFLHSSRHIVGRCLHASKQSPWSGTATDGPVLQENSA